MQFINLMSTHSLMRKKAFGFPHISAVERKMQGANRCIVANWHKVHPVLRNLMILFVRQRKMLDLEAVQQRPRH